MPTISGNLFFDNTLNQTGTTAISNVEIVLQNTSTNVGLAVLTDASGAFVFNNVPAGSYRLVESYNFGGGVASPGDFSTAGSINVPIGEDPPSTFVPTAPAGTNLLRSTTPNTILLTVTTANITGQTFRDGPFVDKPLIINDVTYIGGNIITQADTGIWGTLPAGTAVGTRPATEPYPGVAPGFTYTNIQSPPDGSYTVANINNYFNFGFIADRTQGDETGRLQMVNGANPGNLFFTNLVSVLPNTYYQFSAYLLNLTSGNPAALGYSITTTGGSTIFSRTEPPAVFTTPRTWIEFGTFFNTGNNTQLNVNLVSQGAAGGGNDYVIDNISLIQATFNDILTTNKSVDKDFANIGDVLNYQVVLTNTGSTSITNLIFIDTVPNGTTFVTDSVNINGTTVPTLNPNSFTMPTPPLPMIPNEVITVTYKVLVNTIPSPNPIANSATANYAFAPQSGGSTVPNAIASNIVTTQINNGDITARKIVDKSFAKIGDIVTYTIPISNIGNTTTDNIILIDTIPIGTTFVTDSLIIDGNTQIGSNPSPPIGASIGTLPVGAISTVSFKVLVITIPSPNPFTNNASFKYNFVVDTTTITIASSGVNTNSVSTTVNDALVSEIKTVNKVYANVGDTLIYTVVLKNTGNVTANIVTFVDTIPTDTTLVSGTFKQDSINITGSPNPPGITLPNSIGPGKASTITFNVTVNTIPSPNPIQNSASGQYLFTIDPGNPNSGLSSLNSNQVVTTVNNANLGNIEKLVDKNFATCGDILTYTIGIPNSGNTSAFNVIVKDTIPSGAIFITNSVAINGITINGVSPLTGVNIGTIAAGTTSTMTFQVQVNC